jgi:LemA protein
MSKNLEEKIQDEIRRRALEFEERKLQQTGEDANKAALSEVTTLSPEEIEIIAKEVRSEFAQQEESSKRLRRKLTLAGAVISVIIALVLSVQYNTTKKAEQNMYNSMVDLDEQVKTAWGQVENVYQRRLDLVPNLVSAVQAYVKHEEKLFEMVTAARTKASAANISKEMLNDPTAVQKFQDAQGELSYVLRRMMETVGKNPNITVDQNFLALQAQLEGTENRIAVERKRFNEAVSQYNAYIKKSPQNKIAEKFKFKEKAYFQAEKGAENAPAVKIN